MRALVALSVLLSTTLVLPGLARAQDDADAAPDAALDPSVDVGDTVFALADTPSTRFPDADDEGPRLTKDARLIVLVVEDERLRVMAPSDDSFGWIPASAVTTDKPAPDLDALLQQLGSQGGMGGGGMGGMGQ